MPLPASGEVEAWIKGKATEIKGDERARPLYHFEYWLEPPADMKGRLTAVAYEFNTPAVLPQSQVSSEQDTGFRILAGGLTCADKVTVTLKFKDGRSQQIAVDGCRLVDKDGRGLAHACHLRHQLAEAGPLALDIGQRPAHIDRGDADARGQRAIEQAFAEPRR